MTDRFDEQAKEILERCLGFDDRGRAWYFVDEDTIVVALRQADAEARREFIDAGLATPDGRPRKVLGTLPLTTDGFVIGEGASVYLRGSAVVGPYVANLHAEHRGGGIFRVFAFHEHHIYSTREAAEGAMNSLSKSGTTP